MESILTSIKKLLGPEEEITNFDTDIIIHINSALMVLTQLGVGPSEGYFITGPSETWNDFLGKDLSKLEAVKSYIYLKVRLLFDPPASSAVIESTNKMIQEFEWRLNVGAETLDENDEAR